MDNFGSLPRIKYRVPLPVRNALLLVLIATGCQRSTAPISEASPAPGRAKTALESNKLAPRKLDIKDLPNAYRIHERVISGGQPEGEAAFEQLAALGVKTIVSVDGARPDVELARRYGLRYVHLPHGYDGISDDRSLALAKAVRDLPGPIYIHCHHGKHRSPTAAAVACVGAGLIEPADAIPILRTAGTNANYRGLYQSAAAARRFADGELDAVQEEFAETAELPHLAEAMVDIEHVHDRLKMVSAADWKSPADHPDLDPPHEALLLREQFTELLRTDEVQKQPQRFRDLLTESERLAGQLEAALREPMADNDGANVAAGQVFERITKNCAACHGEFRDVPLGEKASPTPNHPE